MIISCYTEFFKEQVGYRIIHILNNFAFLLISSIIAQADLQDVSAHVIRHRQLNPGSKRKKVMFS